MSDERGTTDKRTISPLCRCYSVGFLLLHCPLLLFAEFSPFTYAAAGLALLGAALVAAGLPIGRTVFMIPALVEMAIVAQMARFAVIVVGLLLMAEGEHGFLHGFTVACAYFATALLLGIYLLMGIALYGSSFWQETGDGEEPRGGETPEPSSP